MFVRTDLWREGTYLDLWSVPHLLSGIALGIILSLFTISPTTALGLTLVLLTLYEVFENYVEIDETPANRVLDVVIGLAGAVPGYLIARELTNETVLPLLALILTVDGVLSLLGWRASRKAALLEARLRTEWNKERAKIRARRIAITAKIRRVRHD